MTTGTNVPMGQYTNATTDQSHLLLDRIFNFDQVLHSIQSGSYDVAPSAVGSMFHVINAFGAVATSFILISLLSVAVMQTAHDGEPFGKRYSTLWMPIRTVMAAAFSAPVKGLGGFSLLQALIIFVVGFSINGANMLFHNALDFFTNNGYTLMITPDMSTPDPSLARNILMSETCMDTLNLSDSAMNTHIAPNTIGLKSHYGYEWLQPNRQTYPSAQCGQVVVDCSQYGSGSADQIAQGFCAVKGHAVMNLANNLAPIALDITQGKQPAPDALSKALTAYKADVQKGVSSLKSQAKGGVKQGLDQFVSNAKAAGWLTAGEWYWTLSSTSLKMQKGLGTTADYTSIDPTTLPTASNELAPNVKRLGVYLRNTTIAGNVLGNSQSSVSASDMAAANADQSSSMSALHHIFGESFGSSTHVLGSLLESGNDPIRSLASYGQDMIGASWGLVGVFAALSAGASAATHSILGWAGAGAGSGALQVLLYPVLAIVTATLGVGAMLAYYLPAIPFFFWMFAVLGWLLMVLESLIAAPLWAASHAVPEGDGFAGRYAMQGWQLMVNVAFRPLLMTVGLLLSLFLMEAICWFAIHGYQIANESIVDSTSSISITGFIITNIIMCGLVIVLSHKSHELIYQGADSVMKWIGFGVSALGSVHGAEQQLSGTFKAGTAQVEKAVMGTIGGGRKGGEGAPQKSGPDSGGGHGGGRNVTAGDTDMPQATAGQSSKRSGDSQAGDGSGATARPGGYAEGMDQRSEAAPNNSAPKSDF